MTVHTDRDDVKSEGVEFIHEMDGSITARDIETGAALFGDTKPKRSRRKIWRIQRLAQRLTRTL